ncbi:MAG TPA: MBL fold metallo-hydrolase [Euzebyales bacterium]|nr:MBL fold metallo-hydrolase [Euzebyales bacterium]
MTDVGDRGAVQSLDAITTRVRAANPSHMTLTGTNTYLIGDPTDGDLVVVDPGPTLPDHRRAIEAAAADRRGQITGMVITHHHPDHAEAVGWAVEWGVDALAFDPARIAGTHALSDGDTVVAGTVEVVAHHHPGHTADHLCLQVPATGAVLTGDHVLGEGTTVIAWPDGELGQYLASLRALRALHPLVLYPGHGEVIDDPAARIDALLAHRRERTRQITAAVADAPVTVDAIVAVVYPDLPGGLRSAAARSVKAHLADLERGGRVVRDGGGWRGA